MVTPQIRPKVGFHLKKVLLSVRWNHNGIVYYESLPINRTINSDVYCGQLNKLHTPIHQKRPSFANKKGIHFNHDNARPQT